MEFGETESLEDMEERLEELRVRRHDLSSENRDNLKPLEDTIRYGIEGLEGEHYLDPNHLLESAAKAVLPDELIDEADYDWDERENGGLEDNSIRTLNTESLTDNNGKVDREVTRPMDQIFADLPQSWQEADEMFDEPPEEAEVNQFFENAREMLVKADFKAYDELIYESLLDGHLDQDDFDSFVDYNEEIDSLILDVKDIGGAVLDDKFRDRENPSPSEYPSGRLTLPETPEQFAQNFTSGMLHEYETAINHFEEQKEQRKSSSAEHEKSREPIKEYQQEIKVDEASLPEEANTYEQQLFGAGARYNHESEGEVDVDMMRKIVRDVRDLEVPDELTPSYEDKQAEAYADLKGAVEAIVEDSEMTIGNGAGNRQALNQLVAGVNYTERNDAVYEDEHVIER